MTIKFILETDGRKLFEHISNLANADAKKKYRPSESTSHINFL